MVNASYISALSAPLLNCITPLLAVRLDSPPALSFSSTPLIMGFSQDELPTAGDWSRLDYSVRIAWGYYWVGMLAWGEDYFSAVFESLGSEKTKRLTTITVSPNPIPGCPSSRRHAAQRNRSLRNCQRNWLIGTITGLKRRIRETSVCQSIERLFSSRHSEGSSKKLRNLGHHNSHVAWSSDSNIRKSRSNSVGKDCDNPKTSASKSCEGNSQSLISPLVWKRWIVLRVLTGERSAMRMPSDLNSLLRNRDCNSLASTNVRAAFGLGLNWCCRVREQSVPGEASSVEVTRKKPTATNWDSLPNDLQENVLQRVDFRDLFRFKTLSNSWNKFIEGEAVRESRGGISEGVFTAINYYIKNKSWRCSGYDLHSRSSRSFPPVSYLPPPDAELFKEYSVCGHGGLMCAEVSKLPKKGEFVVFNPLTGQTRALPPLLHPRNPVLVHITVDSAKKSYKVIVAGSSAASDEHLSRKVEVFDSSTSKWKEVCDLPGPAFGLNEHQAGLCLNGKLFFISFLESGGSGVVAFDVENGTWLPDLVTAIPWSSYSNTVQLVESDGKLFVFSEQEPDQSVDHCIDELEFPNPKAGVSTCRWRSLVNVKKSDGLQVYPEHTRVGFRREMLGIFKPLTMKLLSNILLASCIATMPTGAFAGDHSMNSPSGMSIPSNALGSPDFGKKAAMTLLVGLTMIGGRFAWGIFRRRQAGGDRFDIMQGLMDSDIPTRGNPLFAILPDISRN